MQHRSIVKSVRLEVDLVDQVIAALAEEGSGYREPNFSEATRYGLILLLAALGKKAEHEGGIPLTAVDSWRRIARLESAIRDLLREEV